MQSDHLYSTCLIVQIFGGSSLRQFDHEKNDVFLLLYPPNQDIFWKRHRNMGSNWFSFNWTKRIKICLRYNCQNARAIFWRKMTNWWIVFNSFKNDPNPKYSITPNFTPGICQSTWASVSYLPKHSYCSIQPFMNQKLYSSAHARYYTMHLRCS